MLPHRWMIRWPKLLSSEPTATNAGVGTELSEFAIAVLVPCYNEEQTIQRVVSDFQTYLPDARTSTIYYNGCF